MDMDPWNMDARRPPPLFPTPPSSNGSGTPSPRTPNFSRFPVPPSPNMQRFPMPPISNPPRRPTPPQSSSGPNSPRFPRPPTPKRRQTPPQSGSSSHSDSSLYLPPPPPRSLRPNYQNNRAATMPGLQSCPPGMLTPEQETVAKRLKGSYIANEEDAIRAEVEAKRNYDNLEDEMIMARKFRRDNAREKKKLEDLMQEAREKLVALRGQWEGARLAYEELRAKEGEMTRLREGIDSEENGMSKAEQERRWQALMEYEQELELAKEKWGRVNAMKNYLIEEEKAVKEKDGRRGRHFDKGIEGHDKRRFAMRSRMARACHYTIYHAKRAKDYRIERERLIPDPSFRESVATLENLMKVAEGYLKGPVDEDTGERFWTMHANRSWWVKIPEGPLGFPPSP